MEFLNEMNQAPLAWLLWASAACIVIFPMIIAEASVGLGSISILGATAYLAARMDGNEHLLPDTVKISMVFMTLVFLFIALVITGVRLVKGDVK